MKQTFYSNGKLLITGEYTVLDGATAFALPTKFGQYLHVEESMSHTIAWSSKDADGSVWFQESIPVEAVLNNSLKGRREYDTLIKILHEAHLANPQFLNKRTGFNIVTELTFPREWGLGTSSTLINNIAQWFGINAFHLLHKSFGGSGYDIACAQNSTPITYSLEQGVPVVARVPFNPIFLGNLYFIYLNQKQNSRSAISSYKERKSDIADAIVNINAITNKVLNSTSLSNFRAALEEHEDTMAALLGQPTVKQKLFPDFNGTVKSLGAWGGDFVLAVACDDPSEYFKALGYCTILTYDQMILK